MPERHHVLPRRLALARQIAIALDPRDAHIELLADGVTAFPAAREDLILVKEHDVREAMSAMGDRVRTGARGGRART